MSNTEQDINHDPPEWEKLTDLPVGEILRRARTHYNLSLDDVAATLHIRAQQLGALEENRPEQLPGRVYAIGFVRAYAEYLGLDGDKMVHLFKVQSVGGRKRPELSMPAPASDSKAPGMLVLMGSLIMLGGLMIGMAVRDHAHNKGPLPVPAVSHVVEGDVTEMAAHPPLTMAVQNIIESRKTEVAATIPQPAPTRITVKALDSVWLEIRNAQKKVVLSRILKEGDSYDVPDQPGLTLDTGDAGALDFLVDGQSVSKLGQKGDVLRNVALDPDMLKNPHAQPAGASKPVKKNPVRRKAPPPENHYNFN
ncbi:MAG TPA: RodZ domain-containing protein [Patescibacteria group bacterium]|jgi:cytoskeletal protein RodZ|nr:RodZ domain-containing protein [Patescibacteria group bacterium]